MHKDQLKNDRLNIFQNYTVVLFRLARSYFVYLNFKRPKNKEKISNDLDFWYILFAALQDQVLIGFYEILNIDKNRKTINVTKLLYALEGNLVAKQKVKEIISKNQSIKNKLGKWRNNVCAHKNNRHISIPGLIEEKHEIFLSELDALLVDLINIADIVSSYFDENNNINYRKEYYKEQKQFLDDKFYQLFGKL